MWIGNMIAWFLKYIYDARFNGLYKDATVWIANRMIPSWAEGQTWGNVIFVKHPHNKNRELLAHEYVHVLQWKKFSIFFLPAYALASVWAFFRYGPKNAYHMNWFEIEARKK